MNGGVRYNFSTEITEGHLRNHIEMRGRFVFPLLQKREMQGRTLEQNFSLPA